MKNKYFYNFFLEKILAKYSPKRIIKLLGEHALEPPSKRVAFPCGAWYFALCKYPHFSKKKD